MQLKGKGSNVQQPKGSVFIAVQ